MKRALWGFWQRHTKDSTAETKRGSVGVPKLIWKGHGEGSDSEIQRIVRPKPTGVQWGFRNLFKNGTVRVLRAHNTSVILTFWKPYRTSSSSESYTNILLTLGKYRSSDKQRFQWLFRNLYERILRAKPTPAVHTTMECGGAISWLGGEICGHLHASATLAPANKRTVFTWYHTQWIPCACSQRRSGHAGETNVLYLLGIERLAVRMYACYYSVHNLPSSGFISNNIKI